MSIRRNFIVLALTLVAPGLGAQQVKDTVTIVSADTTRQVQLILTSTGGPVTVLGNPTGSISADSITTTTPVRVVVPKTTAYELKIASPAQEHGSIGVAISSIKRVPGKPFFEYTFLPPIALSSTPPDSALQFKGSNIKAQRVP